MVGWKDGMRVEHKLEVRDVDIEDVGSINKGRIDGRIMLEVIWDV